MTCTANQECQDGIGCVDTCQGEGVVMDTNCCSPLVEDTYSGSGRCCPSGQYWSAATSECKNLADLCNDPISVYGIDACCPSLTYVNGVWINDYAAINIVYGGSGS